jgi:hypothetical protein
MFKVTYIWLVVFILYFWKKQIPKENTTGPTKDLIQYQFVSSENRMSFDTAL